jgi:alanine racemase
MEIDLAAIAHNVGELRRNVVGDGLLYVALKANGYGHGAVAVAEVAAASGADGLAVTEIRDALQIRRAGIDVPVLLYGGYLLDAAAVSAIQYANLSPTISDCQSAELLSAAARSNIAVFIKVDVGLERLGAYPEDAIELAKAVALLPKLTIGGIYTHLHGGNSDRSKEYLTWQLNRFSSVLAALRAANIHPPVTMAASSTVIALLPEVHFNAADVGHLVYGLVPGVAPKPTLLLRRAFLGLKTRLVQVKHVNRSEFLEDAPFSVAGVARIGVLPVGRGDGLAHFSVGAVLVRGQRAAMVGQHSLEHSRVDLSGILDAAVGDEVVLIGRQGEAEISLDEVMARQGTDAVGVVTSIPSSIPRRYTAASRR